KHDGYVSVWVPERAGLEARVSARDVAAKVVDLGPRGLRHSETRDRRSREPRRGVRPAFCHRLRTGVKVTIRDRRGHRVHTRRNSPPNHEECGHGERNYGVTAGWPASPGRL